MLESKGQHAAFVCDLASYAIHFERLGWMTAYDVEPLITLETKRKWQQWALDTNALLIFPHDPLPPAGSAGRGRERQAARRAGRSDVQLTRPTFQKAFLKHNKQQGKRIAT